MKKLNLIKCNEQFKKRLNMEKISEILKDLEKKYDIEIIYAVEAGSRAWSLESEDSDYDIRFIYKQKNNKKYLSLRQAKETIDGFSEDRLYDWQGWDIIKALRHIHQMNPSITEWIYSPIKYIDNKEFRTSMENLLKEQKRISPLLHHYRSMGKSNYKAHIQNKTNVKIKKYLYVIRPIGMFEWLINCQKENGTFIQIDFNVVLNDIKPILGNELYENIVNVIEKKKTVKEMDEEPRIPCIDQWIENILNNTNEKLKQVESGLEKNEEFEDKYDNLLHQILNLKL